MDERTAGYVVYIDATLAEMSQLAARGRAAYDSDIAVARACQYNIVRLAAHLECLGESWCASHPTVPWRLIKGMRNRIARDHHPIDDDIVWTVVEQHAAELHHLLAEEINAARSVLEAGQEQRR